MPPFIQLDTVTGEPYVPLPAPFASFRLTPLHAERFDPSDIDIITRILSTPSVNENLSRAPEPYTRADAVAFLRSHCASDATFEADALDWTDEVAVRAVLAHRVPFDTLRRARPDGQPGWEIVGHVGVRRNAWEWLAGQDPIRMKALIEENLAKEDGDSTIEYSVGELRPAVLPCRVWRQSLSDQITVSGYYLDPELQGSGLMTSALSLSLSLAREYMCARRFEGICRDANIGSRRVLEKCGFRQISEVAEAREMVSMPWKGRTEEIRVLRFGRP